MPYIFAVIALVIVGVGFTLFQNQATSLVVMKETEVNSENVIDVAKATSSSLFDFIEDKVGGDDEASDNPKDIPEPPEIVAVPATPTPTTPNPAPSAPTPPAPIDNNTYNNGTYYTQKSYRTPDGTYQMDVALTISNDIVTSASLSFDTRGSRSKYSKRFASSYQAQVIGKNLSAVSLSRVSGASLTTNAFNNAVNTIAAQAS
ncbi:MAG: hypothetical protein AAB618_02730 [Patescibacteria group bacterium]